MCKRVVHNLSFSQQIAILDSTVSIGSGSAIRRALKPEIIIGTLNYEKAEFTADECYKILEESSGKNCNRTR
jgi:hypothetical protein